MPLETPDPTADPSPRPAPGTDHTQLPLDDSGSADTAADAIADALFRLRGRRRGPGGPGGPRGPGGAGAHSAAAHSAGAHTGAAPRGPWGDPLRGRGFPDPRQWADVAAGRGGPPALIRMLEALAGAGEPLSVSAIGEAIGVDQPRASRLVQQGVARELVVREADPDDARRTRIALTELGQRFATGVRSTRRASLGRALEAFTTQEQQDLARLLGKLADHWPE